MKSLLPVSLLIVFSVFASDHPVPDAARQAPQPSQPLSVRAFQLEATDPDGARALYEKGCAAGEAAACAGQALFLEKSGQKEEALKQHNKACRLGDGYACYQMAQAAAPADRGRLWKQSCHGGVAYSCFLWGADLMDKAQDAEAAFKKGCAMTDVHSCNGLGVVAQQKKQLDKAKEIFEKVCAKRADLGCNNLGLVELQLGNKERAVALLEKTCREKIDYHACNSLGVVAKQSGDLKVAEQMYRLACENGVPSGCRNLQKTASR
ncbi:MAG: sel1 repeat family protein [Bdellovibrionales bacterium]|nr:sel1 repeat family protein [Bdellovibrionales bacterium]